MAETPVRAAVETMSDTGSEWMVIDDEGSDKPKETEDPKAKSGGLDQDSELDLCFICDPWHPLASLGIPWHPVRPIWQMQDHARLETTGI